MRDSILATRPRFSPTIGVACLATLLVVGGTATSADGRLAPTPIWTLDGAPYLPQIALLGLAVGRAGDLDGDGFEDLIVGAPASSLGCCQPGAVLVFRGSVAGPLTAPDWLLAGPTYGAGYGAGVGSAGDVNGDGYDDLILSGSYESEPNRAVVFHGAEVGISPGWSFTTAPGGTFWPSAATGAGDVDGDGFDDVIVGDRSYTAGAYRQGRALVFRGSPTGLETTPAWTVTGSVAQENLGFTVASAGDVDGDGFDDVVLGTANQARLYRGTSTGPEAIPAWTAPMQPVIGSYFSYGEVAGAGDVDGDGYDDVVVGSAGFSNGQNQEGMVELYLGSAMGLATTPVRRIESDRAGSLFGSSVDGAGDIDADGFADLIVGDGSSRGAASLFLGAAAGPALTPSWFVEGANSGDSFGRAVRGAGDANGDGRDDVIVGAPGGTGKAFLYLGVPAESAGPAAAVPDGEGGSVPLRIARGPGTALTLSWGVSCLADEMDWAIYEGSLGQFDDHVAAACTTGGQPGARIVPEDGDRYFLVVPRTLDFEGSYGTASDGLERPPSADSCLAQGIASCP